MANSIRNHRALNVEQRKSCLWWGKIGEFRALVQQNQLCAEIDAHDAPDYWMRASPSERKMMANAFKRIAAAIGNSIPNAYIFLEQDLSTGRMRADALVVAPKNNGFPGWCVALIEAKYLLRDSREVENLCSQIERYRAALLAGSSVVQGRGEYKKNMNYLLRTVVIIDQQVGAEIEKQLKKVDAKIFSAERTNYVREIWKHYMNFTDNVSLDGPAFSREIAGLASGKSHE